MKTSNLLFVAILIVLFLESCSIKYQKYHADWIVTHFDINGVNSLNIVGIFNFKININKKQAVPLGLYLEGSKFMLRDNVNFEINTENGIDLIRFKGHPFFTKEYQIQCLDEDCCSVSLKNDEIYLEMIYNSDIPWGVSRDCR